jgi:hypothetical protein
VPFEAKRLLIFARRLRPSASIPLSWKIKPMSSDAELVKAFFDAAFEPAKDIANRLFGPVADELGAVLANPVRIFRLRQSVRLLQKVERICAEAGIDPKAVPLKTLLPILENASVEEEEDLHDRYANMLANAANPAEGGVHPAFPEILRELSATEARFLDAVYEHVAREAGRRQISFDASTVESIELGRLGFELVFAEAGLTRGGMRFTSHDGVGAEVEQDRTDFGVASRNLIRHQLLELRIRRPIYPPAGLFASETQPNPIMTQLGFTFTAACRKPRVK